MLWTSVSARSTIASCWVRKATARPRPPWFVIQTAPFSATPSSAASTQKSTSRSRCGSATAAGSTFARSTPGTSDATLAADRYCGKASRASSSEPRTNTQVPPTAATLRANWSRRSGYRSPRNRASSGNATGGGEPARTAFRISSRAPTFPPDLAEALPGHRRKIALAAPGVCAEQARRQQGHHPAHQLAGDLVEPAPREHEGADARDDSLSQRDEALPGQLAPPGEKLVVQIDVHRADVAARAAEGGRERQAGVLRRIRMRRQRGSDGPRHRHPVAVPAAAPVHRAGIQARAAADALEGGAEFAAAEDLAAPAIDDDDVQLARGPGAVEVRGIRGDRLPRRGAREEPEEDRQLARARHDLLDPHAGDVQRRQRGAEIGIAFVRADDDSAGLRDCEVHSGQAGVRGEELLAQVLPRRFGERLGIGEPLRCAQLLVEQVADLLLLQVDGGHHDVRGRLVPELDDPLAQIGVHHLDAALFQVRIEVALLGEHRLALHQPLHAAFAEDPVHDPVVLVRVARPVYDRAELDGVRLELLQIPGEARERVRLDLRGGG